YLKNCQELEAIKNFLRIVIKSCQNIADECAVLNHPQKQDFQRFAHRLLELDPSLAVSLDEKNNSTANRLEEKNAGLESQYFKLKRDHELKLQAGRAKRDQCLVPGLDLTISRGHYDALLKRVAMRERVDLILSRNELPFIVNIYLLRLILCFDFAAMPVLLLFDKLDVAKFGIIKNLIEIKEAVQSPIKIETPGLRAAGHEALEGIYLLETLLKSDSSFPESFTQLSEALKNVQAAIKYPQQKNLEFKFNQMWSNLFKKGVYNSTSKTVSNPQPIYRIISS
ncbi:MAG: hypothetical protein JSR33_12400, partial [Proteobacteria bacterium]|nr:hypothetical protein [Pseudomonadota bacterium]